MTETVETKGSASVVNTELVGSAETLGIMYTDCLFSIEIGFPFLPPFGRNEAMLTPSYTPNIKMFAYFRSFWAKIDVKSDDISKNINPRH